MTAYEVHARGGGVFLITEPDDGPVVGAFYQAGNGSSGWWRGHWLGRARQVWAPGAEPLDVASRITRR